MPKLVLILLVVIAIALALALKLRATEPSAPITTTPTADAVAKRVYCLAALAMRAKSERQILQNHTTDDLIAWSLNPTAAMPTERLYALNWLCGKSTNWDKVRTTT